MGEKKPEAAQTDATPAAPIAGPGVGSLLSGAKRPDKNVFAEAQPQRATEKKAAPKPLIPRWYFFAADVLLIVFALAILFRSSGRLDFGQAVICVLAIVVAGVLGVIGVWMGRKE